MTGVKNSKAGKTGFAAKFLDSAAFAKKTYPRGWLVEQILVHGQPAVLGGPKKSLKTSLAIDLAISLGSGKPFLGKFPVPKAVRVAVMSGESGEAAVQDLAHRVCTVKGLSLQDCDVLWSADLPSLGTKSDRMDLKDFLRKNKVKVVIIDPLYLCLLAGSGGKSASNIYEIGPLLRLAGRACLSAGATPILIHHTTKGKNKKTDRPEPLDLGDLAYAGIAEYARQWLLVNRREPYLPSTGDSRLLLAVGGSAGHSGCWQVDVTEGVQDTDFKGRKWRVKVHPMGKLAVERAEDERWDK